MSNGPKIHVDLKKAIYTTSGPIATGILSAIARLKNAAYTIHSISLTDSESTCEPFGYGLRFEIVIQIPDLIPNRIIVTDDYFGPKLQSSLIATFIESRWKNAIYNEVAKLRKTAENLEKIVSDNLIL